MGDYTTKVLECSPYFDLELFLGISQETRIGGDMMDRLSDAWERWLPHAHARQIQVKGKDYLLVWLGEQVEEDVDDKWEETPSEAFLYNALAQVMCMGLVHFLLPEVEEAGCAPAPFPSDDLAEILEAENVPYVVQGEPGLSRRYAIVTWYPFKGGCEVCFLQKQCPKAGGGGDTSVTLPGYE